MFEALVEQVVKVLDRTRQLPSVDVIKRMGVKPFLLKVIDYEGAIGGYPD